MVAAPEPKRRQRVKSEGIRTRVAPSLQARNEVLWLAAIEELYQCGFIVGVDGKRPQQVGTNAYACFPGSVGWSAVARELAALLPGQVKPSAAHQCRSLAWKNGSFDNAGVLLEPELAESVSEAQRVVRMMLPSAPERWTMGGLCRLLFSYIGARDFCAWPKKGATNIGADRLLDGVSFGYMHVEPGEYTAAYYHDVSSYYYSMLCRLPTLRPDIVNGRVLFSVPDVAEHERFQRVLRGIAEHKALRNTLAGVAMGSFKGMPYFCTDSAGKVVKRISYAHGGPFRAAGLLLVRSGYELTLEQCRQQRTIYARIDSAITLTDRQEVWERYGFRVKAEHSGETEICQLGSYKVGDYATKPYQNGNRGHVPKLGAMEPHPVEYSTWLR